MSSNCPGWRSSSWLTCGRAEVFRRYRGPLWAFPPWTWAVRSSNGLFYCGHHTLLGRRWICAAGSASVIPVRVVLGVISAVVRRRHSSATLGPGETGTNQPALETRQLCNNCICHFAPRRRLLRCDTGEPCSSSQPSLGVSSLDLGRSVFRTAFFLLYQRVGVMPRALGVARQARISHPLRSNINYLASAAIRSLKSAAAQHTYRGVGSEFCSPPAALLGRFLPRLGPFGFPDGLFFCPEPKPGRADLTRPPRPAGRGEPAPEATRGASAVPGCAGASGSRQWPSCGARRRRDRD